MKLDNFTEIIDYAIEKEEEAASLYEKCVDMSDKPNIKAMFKELAQQEKGHKAKLQRVKEGDVSGYKVESIPDLKISNYLVDVQFRTDMTYQEVLILAMKREENSQKLYTDLANDCQNTRLKELLVSLASEESKHKLNLETEYDEVVLDQN